MSYFIISEVLGQCFADEWAFEILCSFRNLAAEEPRVYTELIWARNYSSSRK
ncbi:hypothetical protein Aazo_1716 ['Nostoc azollae' 0708]|uniref:Uncharacterized protein n=1 Tax=Nostoc azollae (strain 0708) TaxID=551115 RepID=D7E566_NOSA0|nr:hypothetical protein Aazo_1716 ['Nostoc azollae' 0708]